MAETESAPDGALFATDRVVVATPLTVSAVVGFSCPYVEFVLKAITAPVMPAPAASCKVAVTVAETPAEIELVERAMVKVGAAAPPLPPPVAAGVPSPQPVSTAIHITSNNDTEKFEIFW